jgi:hypothetical protein
MTKTRGFVPPAQLEAPTDRTIRTHLFQLADGAYAKAERNRRSWRRTRRAKTPEVATRLRRPMLKHQAIAYHLDSECRGVL